jgi:23S rRNA U2552 (ribose-2'-O)-methylase RlmE/FtsJ
MNTNSFTNIFMLPFITSTDNIHTYIRSNLKRDERAGAAGAAGAGAAGAGAGAGGAAGAGVETPNDVKINKTLNKYLLYVKEKIESYTDRWDKYKKYTNPYEYIHSPIPNTKNSVSTMKPLSRSFFKMIEMYISLDLLEHIPPSLPQVTIKSFHLAEGPGGFIEALAYMRNNTNDTYYGMTLIDDVNQNVPGWRKSKYFLSKNPNVIIEKGIEQNGNIMRAENLRFCYRKYHGTMDLVTGDGGFDFSCHYPQQEQISTKLIMCQIAFAISIQKLGGTFVLKMFDIFTQFSIDLMFLLSNLYDNVTIIKPNTSRFANSEKYVVCKGFRDIGTDKLVETFYHILLNIDTLTADDMSRLFNMDIPYLFTRQIEEINAILGQQQIDNIVSTITLIEHNNNHEKIEQLKKKNIQKCITWCQKFNIPYNKFIQPNNVFMSGMMGAGMGSGLVLTINKPEDIS